MWSALSTQRYLSVDRASVQEADRERVRRPCDRISLDRAAGASLHLPVPARQLTIKCDSNQPR